MVELSSSVSSVLSYIKKKEKQQVQPGEYSGSNRTKGYSPDVTSSDRTDMPRMLFWPIIVSQQGMAECTVKVAAMAWREQTVDGEQPQYVLCCAKNQSV